MRAWVRMPSGKRLDLLNPTPFDWDDADLALGLARTYRWGGHTAWPGISPQNHITNVRSLKEKVKSELLYATILVIFLFYNFSVNIRR